MNLLTFLHLAAAVVWLGGMSFVLLVLRPSLLECCEPQQRVRLLLACMGRFFPLVWGAVALLLGTGASFFTATAGHSPAPGWLVMAACGALMSALFVYLAVGPWQRARRAAARQDWGGAGLALGRVHRIVQVNFALGWIALGAITLLH